MCITESLCCIVGINTLLTNCTLFKRIMTGKKKKIGIFHSMQSLYPKKIAVNKHSSLLTGRLAEILKEMYMDVCCCCC